MDLMCTEKLVLNDGDNLLNNSDDSDHEAASCIETITAATGNITESSSNSVDGHQQKQKSATTSAAAANSLQDIHPKNFYVAGNICNTAVMDPIFLEDRCLENLLKTEERYMAVCSYFETVQTEITPPMRKIVTEWMMEVCEEQKCQDDVVLLAINYLDRFLATTFVRKQILQLIASACLLLASKLREPSCRGLSADLLVYYTDNSITKQDLIHWELCILNRLKWDVAAVTPVDFLELILIRLPIKNNQCLDISLDKTRQHAQAFIALAAKEHYLSAYTASTIAASSIAAALRGLNWHLRTGIGLRYLLNRLTDLTGVEQDYLKECMNKLEDIFEETSRMLQPFLGNQPIIGKNNCNTNSCKNPATATQMLSCKIQACTPTDVQDLRF